MRRWLTVLAVLVAGSVAAADRRFADFLGFTPDGAFAAYTLATYAPGDEEEPESDYQVGLVVDVRTGAKESYLLRGTGPKEVTLKKGDFDGWVASAKLVKKPGRASPDGKATAWAELKSEEGKAVWKKDALQFGCADGEDCLMTEGKLTFAVERDGKRWVLERWAEGSAGNLHGTLEPFWSPDGRRLAWVLNRGYAMMNDFGYGRVLITPTGGPRLEVLADKAFPDAAVGSVLGALDQAGFIPARRGEALKAREKSVLYAAKGYEAQAKKLASAVPGGASLEKLSWATDAELVLALGKSAVR